MTTKTDSSGCKLVAVDGRTLPLKSTRLESDAKGGLARTRVLQTFTNPYAEPLAVTYQLPLPAEGAVSAFSFVLGGKRIVGEVDRRAAARERFEQALVEGRTAALLEQERSSFFTQELGNLPPHAEVICEVAVDHPLAWLSEGAWEWRFPTVVAPRYPGGAGRVADAEKVSVDVADAPSPIAASLSLSVRDRCSSGSRPESPSHRIASRDGDVDTVVELSAEQGASLDRDVVVRWAVAQPRIGMGIDLARPKSGPNADRAFGLLTVVPPAPGHALPQVSRDLIVLLDTSGSMGGEPLDQARRVVSALIDTLGDQDQLELIEFSSAARHWKRGSVAATQKNRKDALHWLAKLQASGGTEMRTGILEALAPLSGESQRQVVVVTDGLIGFEHEVVGEILRKLPRGSRVHTVGVGSGVNRSLTAPAARAGRGLEVVIGLGEDPERAARRLVARTAAPQVVDLEVTGSALLDRAPAKLPDLFAGAPTRIALALRPDGGELLVRGRTAQGTFEERVSVPAASLGSGNAALATLFGREQVEDLETELAAGGEQATLDARIESLGLAFQIATRMTSWIAVTEQATVDPRDPTRHERIPQMLPHGMSMEGLGLRPVSMPPMTPMGAVARSAGGAPAPQGIRARLSKTAIREEPAKEAAKRPSAPKQVASHQTAAPRLIDWVGQVLRWVGGGLLFQFASERAVAWNPLQAVIVHFADGSQKEVPLNDSASTRGGSLAAGLLIRVALELGPASPRPTEVELTLDGGRIRIRLE